MALAKCKQNINEIHRLLREHSSSSTSSSSARMSSVESSPTEPATSRFARSRWNLAYRVAQSVHRLKQPLHKKQFDRFHEESSRESTPASTEPFSDVDPVYLALKQATGRYGSRRSSATNFASNTPSPRNLSQVSLQDSGYAELATAANNVLLGSTPQLDNTGRTTARRRAPKLSSQMKSLSLDCQDMPPRIQAATRSPIRVKVLTREGRALGSSDFSDAALDRSCSPCTVPSRRCSTSVMHQTAGFIVIHEYTPPGAPTLQRGERIRVVDNGDPDWLHGFRLSDRTEHLMTFPATCVCLVQPDEQPMRILHNVVVSEQKLRMYRDQVVFVQPNSLNDGKVLVRTAAGQVAPCPLASLALM